jgi:hypothetical protein
MTTTHNVIKYQLSVFWDDEFKHLDYDNEEFNDSENLSKWLKLGYPNRFTGNMCDMRKSQPGWNFQFIQYFTKLGWKDIGTSYYQMMPGTILPTHGDLYKKYINMFDLQGQEHNIRRAIIFLEDWQSGHYLEIMDTPVTGWSAGTTIEWTYDTPHLAANMGITPRYTLQITGHL